MHTRSRRAHIFRAALLMPLLDLPLHCLYLLQMLLGRRAQLEHDPISKVENDIVEKGHGQQKHDENPPVVHHHVFNEFVQLGLFFYRHLASHVAIFCLGTVSTGKSILNALILGSDNVQFNN